VKARVVCCNKANAFDLMGIFMSRESHAPRQLTVSLELVYLLDWLCSQGKEQLQALVAQAVRERLAKDLEQITDKDYLSMSGRLHEVVTSFVALLEQTLDEELEKIVLSEEVSSRLLSRRRLEQDLLVRFLKHWDPSKNEPIN